MKNEWRLTLVITNPGFTGCLLVKIVLLRVLAEAAGEMNRRGPRIEDWALESSPRQMKTEVILHLDSSILGLGFVQRCASKIDRMDNRGIEDTERDRSMALKEKIGSAQQGDIADK